MARHALQHPAPAGALTDDGAAPPTLDLSGPALRAAMQALIAGSEGEGGVERYVEALKLKAALFQEALAQGRATELDGETFKTLCAFMAPVRRRVGAWLQGDGFAAMREAVIDLLDGAIDTRTADARVGAFCARQPGVAHVSPAAVGDVETVAIQGRS